MWEVRKTFEILTAAELSKTKEGRLQLAIDEDVQKPKSFRDMVKMFRKMDEKAEK